MAKSPINVNTSKRNSACRRSGAASTLLVEKTGDGEESFLVALADCRAPPSFFKSLLHTPVRTTASSCSLLGIPSTHSDLLLYSILFCPIQSCYHTTALNLTLSAIPVSQLNPPYSPPPPLLSTPRSATIRGCPIAQRQKSIHPILQHYTKHASRYRQHGCRRVMIGSVCRTTPTTQAPLRRPMRQPLPSHAPKASPRFCRTTTIATTNSTTHLPPAIPRHSLEPG